MRRVAKTAAKCEGNDDLCERAIVAVLHRSSGQRFSIGWVQELATAARVPKEGLEPSHGVSRTGF